MLPATFPQADLEACPTEEILIVADPEKVYGEQWYFTFTAEAFETQLKLQTAGAEEEKARKEAEAEVGASESFDRGRSRADKKNMILKKYTAWVYHVKGGVMYTFVSGQIIRSANNCARADYALVQSRFFGYLLKYDTVAQYVTQLHQFMNHISPY